MSLVPRISNVFNKFTHMFQPKLHVVGLGRWGSTISKEKEHISWFHDMCNSDNCYSNMFNIVRFASNNNPPSTNPDSVTKIL